MRTSPVLNACYFKSIEEIDFKVDLFHSISLENQFNMSCDLSRNLIFLWQPFLTGMVFKILNFSGLEQKLLWSKFYIFKITLAFFIGLKYI